MGQGRNERGRGGEISCAPNHLWAPKSPNNVIRTFFNTVHLLLKDLRFAYGCAWCDLMKVLLNLFVESAANDQATYSEWNHWAMSTEQRLLSKAGAQRTNATSQTINASQTINRAQQNALARVTLRENKITPNRTAPNCKLVYCPGRHLTLLRPWHGAQNRGSRSYTSKIFFVFNFNFCQAIFAPPVKVAPMARAMPAIP